METHKGDQEHLDELFNKARQEKPLMNLDEVKSILPLTSQPAIHSAAKGFHFSISTIVVGTGIVVSSALSYMVVVDKHDASSKKEVAQQVAPAVPSAPKETPKPKEVALPVQQSSPNPNLLASTDKKLITPPATKYKKVSLDEENVPSQKLTITSNFHFNDKHYRITLVGMDVTMVQADDVIIPSDEYPQHAGAISTARGYAEDRIKEEGDKQFLMSFFDKKLRVDKLPGDENHYVFLLTSSHLYIDGVPQDDKTFALYSQLYKEQTGKEIAGNDEYQYKMQRKQLVNKDVYGFKTK